VSPLHCNTLQLTATHWNTLQHCVTLSNFTMLCSKVSLRSIALFLSFLVCRFARGAKRLGLRVDYMFVYISTRA